MLKGVRGKETNRTKTEEIESNSSYISDLIQLVPGKLHTSSNSALLFIRNSPLGGADGKLFLGNSLLS